MTDRRGYWWRETDADLSKARTTRRSKAIMTDEARDAKKRDRNTKQNSIDTR